MGARDGDAVLEPHELGQHLGPWNDGHAPLPRHLDLDIVAGHRRGVDDHVRALDVTGLVAEEHLGPEPLQSLDELAALLIGAGDAIAQVQEHLGDPAHADAADAHEMNLLVFLVHGSGRSRVLRDVEQDARGEERHGQGGPAEGDEG